MLKRRIHSRFARELQRRCGSKQNAEVIMFSGCWDANLMRRVLDKGDASQLARGGKERATIEERRMKAKIVQARGVWRQRRSFAEASARGCALHHRELDLVSKYPAVVSSSARHLLRQTNSTQFRILRFRQCKGYMRQKNNVFWVRVR